MPRDRHLPRGSPGGSSSPQTPVCLPSQSSPISLQEVPCSCALPRGLWPGQVIVLRGLVLPEPKEYVSTWKGGRDLRVDELHKCPLFHL